MVTRRLVPPRPLDRSPRASVRSAGRPAGQVRPMRANVKSTSSERPKSATA